MMRTIGEAPQRGDSEVSMNAEDDPIWAALKINDIAIAEDAWFEGWRPKYQPPAAPPPPTQAQRISK